MSKILLRPHNCASNLTNAFHIHGQAPNLFHNALTNINIHSYMLIFMYVCAPVLYSKNMIKKSSVIRLKRKETIPNQKMSALKLEKSVLTLNLKKIWTDIGYISGTFANFPARHRFMWSTYIHLIKMHVCTYFQRSYFE